MKEFIRQFLPALAAGMLVLLATFILQRQPEQSGSLRYEYFSHYADIQKLTGTEKYTPLYQFDAIRIYNFGDEELRDFTLVLSEIRPSTSARATKVAAKFDRVIASKPVDSNLVGKDGVMRLPISKFEAGGEMDILLEDVSINNFSLDIAQRGIEIHSISQWTVSNRSPSDFSALISFLSVLVALFASVLTFLVARQKDVRRVQQDADELVRKIEEYSRRKSDD